MIINGGYPGSLICRSACIAWWLSGKASLAVMNFHNSADEPPWYYKPFEYLIDALVDRSSSFIVSVSKSCIDSLQCRNFVLRPGKFICISNGIADPVAPSNSALDFHAEVLFSRPYCLMLATYEPRKGHTFLLEAFKFVLKEFPDIDLRIYGHGTSAEIYKVSLELHRLGLGSNVFLSGFSSDSAGLIKHASMIVVPSQSDESFGLTIIEAMANSVPVVITDVGGMPEVFFGSDAGYMCSKSDPVEFGNRIKDILRDKEVAASLGSNGRLSFERRFTSKMMCAKYRSLILFGLVT
jgi:glycosyltransferase involved in cell wall biosynthesis